MDRSELFVRKPCHANWERMRRLEDKRYCDVCDKYVHDVSAMSAEEARVLLAQPRDKGLCVRYLYDDAGNVVFRPSRLIPGSSLIRAKRFAAAAMLPLGLAACSAADPEPVMMGDIGPDPNTRQIGPNENWEVIVDDMQVDGQSALPPPEDGAVVPAGSDPNDGCQLKKHTPPSK
jgi:hypothetical protein